MEESALLAFWEKINFTISFECQQLTQEGFLLDPSLLKRIDDARNQNDVSKLYSLREELKTCKFDSTFPYFEPSTLEEIRGSRPIMGLRRKHLLATESLRDQIYGGWLGRAAGCCLGKPIEKWPREVIEAYLQFYSAMPLKDFIPTGKGFPKNHPAQFRFSGQDCTRGNIDFMPRDDDMDYPVLGLVTLERSGFDTTSLDIAETWLDKIPIKLVFTAERVAYRNMVNGIDPPASATHNNPYREWIGAQIRADIWGYVAPGWPEKAAELAFRDASITSTKNGIYGEMFFAAMIAGAFITNDVKELIDIGLSEIPAKSRLSEVINNTLAWSKTHDSWSDVWTRIDALYGHYDDVHTIKNAAMIVLGLLRGNGDFEKTITTTVLGGWDADCTGATAGSIAGVMLGSKYLPDKWVGVFNDRLKTSVRDFEDVKISALADRTFSLAKLSLELT